MAGNKNMQTSVAVASSEYGDENTYLSRVDLDSGATYSVSKTRYKSDGTFVVASTRATRKQDGITKINEQLRKLKED